MKKDEGGRATEGAEARMAKAPDKTSTHSTGRGLGTKRIRGLGGRTFTKGEKTKVGGPIGIF